jgi:RNA polymerase primary sigma factor
MAATLPKLSSSPSASRRAPARRAARMSTKAKAAPRVTDEPDETADELPEALAADAPDVADVVEAAEAPDAVETPEAADLDGAALAADSDDEDDEPAPARRRADGGTYLSMYFRDMAALDVLRPEQEFTTAREIEALETLLWETALGFPAAVPLIADELENHAPGLAELRALRKAADEVGKGASRRAASDRFGRAVKKCAVAVREKDADKLFADAVVALVEHLVRGTGPRTTVTKARGFADWARRVRAADRAAHDARNDFVKANLRLVVSIARRFNHGRMALADLIQEGNLGLMKAVERYDYRRGFRFSTYASWWIRHAISRALADKGREIRLPVHMIDAQHRLAKARRELTAKLGRTPTTEELAGATAMPADKIEKMRSWILDQSISLDRPVGDEDGRNLAEVLEDPEREASSPSDELALEAMSQEVRSLLDELKPIEADILRRRFGLDDDQELTLKEIGEKYNLSRERIRQLQEQALIKMRRALERKEMI